MTSPSLYELAAEYRSASDVLYDLNLPDDAVRDTLESLSGDIETKAVNTLKLVRNLEAAAEQIKAAEKSMYDRRKAYEARAERIRSYVLDALLFAGMKKVECPLFVAAVRENPPSVSIQDAEKVPEAYLADPPLPKPQPDKKLIAMAIKDGHDVPGCSLVYSRRLDIK